MVLFVQGQSRKGATAGGPLSWISSLLVTAISFLALAMLFALGAGAIRRYSGAGAGALAGGPATSITGGGAASFAPKEYNKVLQHYMQRLHSLFRSFVTLCFVKLFGMW